MIKKLKVPLPVRQDLAGEVEEIFDPLPPWMSSPDSYNPPKSNLTRSMADATALGKSLMSRGIGPRAIVVTKDAGMDKWIDPHYWGIVIAMPLLEPKPVQVVWVAGENRVCRYHDGDDLVCIYPTRDKQDLMADFRSRSPVL